VYFLKLVNLKKYTCTFKKRNVCKNGKYLEFQRSIRFVYQLFCIFVTYNLEEFTPLLIGISSMFGYYEVINCLFLDI